MRENARVIVPFLCGKWGGECVLAAMNVGVKLSAQSSIGIVTVRPRFSCSVRVGARFVVVVVFGGKYACVLSARFVGIPGFRVVRVDDRLCTVVYANATLHTHSLV